MLLCAVVVVINLSMIYDPFALTAAAEGARTARQKPFSASLSCDRREFPAALFLPSYQDFGESSDCKRVRDCPFFGRSEPRDRRVMLLVRVRVFKSRLSGRSVTVADRRTFSDYSRVQF